MSKVLVTGGSGFIGSHCIAKLLLEGHAVRTTVRRLARASEVKKLVTQAGVDPQDRIEFFEADLEKDAGWAEAVQGCDYVLHVASPFPPDIPKHEDELIKPAREGALRVLRAARDAGVKRVVLTSSFAAIGYGHPSRTAPFTEKDWTNVDGPGVTAYAKSKTLAEKAAWEFIQKEGGKLELATVNPVAVFGPVLAPDTSTSVLIVQRLLNGSVPGCPKITFGAVDVRDVVDLHLKAMQRPEAKGQRFLAVAGEFVSIFDIAKILRKHLGASAKRVPRIQLPNWLVRLAALRDPSIKQILPELGRLKNATSEKAQRILGWKPRATEEAVLATANSLKRLGMIPA